MNSKNFKAYLALACVCFFWGTTYLAIRIGVASIPPFLFSGVRQVTAGLILIGYFLIKGHNLPAKKELLQNVIAGILMIGFGNGLVAWGELYITSGLAALICSLVPIWIILLNLLIRSKEKMNWQIITGTSLGFTGILIIFGDNIKDFTNTKYTLGIVAILFANLTWAIGTLYNKNIKKSANPILSAGIQVFSGGIALLIASLFFEIGSSVTLEWTGLASLVYLIFFGTILGYGAYIYALSVLPTSIVSIYAYINPLVAIILGWLLLNEKITIYMSLAFLITISGIYLVNKGFSKEHKI